MKFESVFIDQVEFHLALTHHVVLQPGNMGAELLLMDLERDGVLPKTVTWGNDDGSTSRLYRIANTRNVGGCYDINLGEFASGNGLRLQYQHNHAAHSAYRFQFSLDPGEVFEGNGASAVPSFRP